MCVCVCVRVRLWHDLYMLLSVMIGCSAFIQCQTPNLTPLHACHYLAALGIIFTSVIFFMATAVTLYCSIHKLETVKKNLTMRGATPT